MLPSNVLEWLWHQLEFNYTDLTRAYREIVECLEHVVSLRPRTDVYTTEQGHSDLLLVLFGPLAANFRGTTYGIPVEIWIPKQYPIGSPIVWVRPTPDMRVNPGSRVDGNGRVYFEWNQHHSLLSLCNDLSHIFGLECPVYSAPSQAGQQHQQQEDPARSAHRQLPPRAAPAIARHTVQNIMDSDDLPAAPPVPQRSSENWDNFRHTLAQTVDSIVENEVQVDLKALGNTREVLEWVQAALDTEHKELGESLASTKSSIRVLDESITSARAKIAEVHAPKYDLIATDDLVVPKSQPAKQLLEAMAQDAALGDTIKALAAGLAHEKLSLELFLKNTRSLARRQFVERHKAECARGVL